MMAWSTPLTAVSNTTLTAAQWNASVRDNLLETATAKASASGTYFAGTGLNGIAERTLGIDSIATAETTTSTSAADLATAGPTVSVTSGTKVVAMLNAGMSNNTVGAISSMFVDVTGATTQGVTNNLALRFTASTAAALSQASMAFGYPVTGGTSQYQAKYSASGGTSTFASRRLTIMPF
jgi:hypothetical protein